MKDLPPLQWLRAFESSARRLSFTQAAEELSITQSAVSQQIKLLENFLGEPLFLRRARSLQLTRAGSNYLPDVQHALQILRHGTRSNFMQSDSNKITIRSNWSFSSLWLTPRISSFLESYPEVSVNIVPVIWEIDYQNLTDDIEIRFGAPEGKSNEIMLREQMWCFPLCTPEIASQIKRPEDMLQFARVNSMGETTPWDKIYQLCGIQNAGSFNQRELTSYAYMLAVDLTRQNLGIMLGIDFISDGLMNSGDLVRLFDMSVKIPESYYLKADRNRLSETENLFCDWMMTQLPG